MAVGIILADDDDIHKICSALYTSENGATSSVKQVFRRNGKR